MILPHRETRSGDRPRRGDPKGAADPFPENEKQSDPDRGAWRGERRLLPKDSPTGSLTGCPGKSEDQADLFLDMGALLRGPSLRGIRGAVKSVIKEVIGSEGEIVLFIDEIHTLVGGASEGAMDAANILKPALSRENCMSSAQQP